MQQKNLEFKEGTASKFWNATQEGTTLTVQYGRIGSAGQTQVKTFASETEAASAFVKQVAEKEKKGYTEGHSTPADPLPPGNRGNKAGSDPPASGPTPASFVPPFADPGALWALSQGRVPREEAGGFRPGGSRRIKLTEKDRLRAAVTPLPPPQPRPEPEPFDAEACLTRLAKLGKPDEWSYYWKWEKLDLTPTMSREEAAFWWKVAYLAHGQSLKQEQLIEKAKALVGKPLAMPELSALKAIPEVEHVVPIFALFGVEGVVKSLELRNQWNALELVKAIESLLLPVLTEEERAELRERLEARLTPTQQEHWVLRLLILLGMSAEALAPEIAKWADGVAKPEYFGGYYGDRGNEYLAVLVGLRDPDVIAQEARRLEALPVCADDIRLLLAATEFRCLDLIARSVLSFTAKAEAETAAKAFALAEAPEVAPYMVDLMLESKAPGIARQWLEDHPAHAARGLLPVAVGQGKKAEIALNYLRGLKKRDRTALVEAALQGQPESVVKAIQERVLDWEEVTYEPLTEAESPEWVKIVFGGELRVPDLPALENPERRLAVEVAPARPALPLPAPQSLPVAPPFDLEGCLATLRPLFDGRYWQLRNLKFNLPMSREEAHFWLEVADHVGKAHWNKPPQPAALEAALRSQTFGKPETRKDAYAHGGLPMLVPFWVLFGRDGLLRFVAQNNQTGDFARAIGPVLNPAQRQELIQAIRERLKGTGNTHYNRAGFLKLLEELGASNAEFDAVLSSLKIDEQNNWWSRQYFPYVVRLEDPEKVLAVATKLGVFPQTEAEGRQWLAATGWRGVERLGMMLNEHYYDKLEAVRILTLVEAPEVARSIASLRKFPSTKLIARGWLDRFPAFVIEGLAPLLVEKDKKAVELATECLRELKRKGLGWLMEKKRAGFDAGVQQALRTRVLDYDPRQEKRVSPGDTALAALLPPVLVKTEQGLRRLTGPQTALLLAELRTTPLTEPSPNLELVRQSAEKRALDTFVWALFEGWLTDGGPSKERWKLEALGHLGGDGVALKLTPLIRNWPGESQHQRAVLGLDCLRAIGTDTALMQINGIAEKVSFKGIKMRAQEAIEAVAAERNFTRDALADRIIPDGGLDSRGASVFDFGPRQFTFLLSPELKPMVRGADGKRLPDLPKPNTKDDPEKAAEALAAWKLLKKQVGEVARSQAVRLEQAMVIGRRWTPEEFLHLFVAHPVMVHLVRRLIWCAYDEAGAALACFRVADDNTLADQNDDLLLLSSPRAGDGLPATTVGIIHPAHLTAAQQGTWGELLADYEIIPPFAQLGRPTYALTEEEKAGRILTRFKGIAPIDPKVLLFGLDNLGWTRGAAQDGGWFTEHYKTFLSAGITAVVNYTGAPVGYLDGWEDQEVEEVYFLRDANEATHGWLSSTQVKSLVPVAQVDPVIVSEVLHDLTRLIEKGKKQ